jgi:IclR family transcriptional regulator, mhp operon transcriptional activator
LSGSYETITAVERTLLILEILSKHVICRVSDIHESCGLPRPTIVRILETLVTLGYVQKLSRLGGYCLDEKVDLIADGYKGFARIAKTSIACADRLTAEFKWPSSIACRDGHHMVVRYSTMSSSPNSHKRSTINHRLDMLRRAHGRAYLAFSSEKIRLEVIQDLSNKEGGLAVRELMQRLEPLFAKIRAQGFARRDAEIDPDTITLAAPIWHDDEVAATLGITFFKRSVKDLSIMTVRLKEAAVRASFLYQTEEQEIQQTAASS